ncbi:hypothetical protein B0H11DRAFT_2375184 [Mycena galericulata]|nr:hypothetical protein B0H11DRAFT_2375184 [Mycena galericulata]
MPPEMKRDGRNIFSSHLLPTSNQSAHLLQILRSNSVPPENSVFHAVMAAAPTQLALYDAEIARSRRSPAGDLQLIVEGRAALQVYVDGCHSIFSPIRRLPPEIMREIFLLCAPAYHDPVRWDWSGRSSKKQLERLAQKHLLLLAGVSSYWLRLIMGTPSLWREVEVDFNNNWTGRHMDILSAVLERSGKTPLHLHVRHISCPLNRAGLELLALHSERWEEANLQMDLAAMHMISSVKGNIPLLRCLRVLGSDFSEVVQVSAGDLTHIVSPMTTLSIQGPSHELCGAKTGWNMGRFLSSLTLPSLRSFTIHPSTLYWPQKQFLKFATRSALCGVLRTLDIQGIDIADSELLEALSELQLLEHLTISDVSVSSERDQHIVITDNLLKGLTRTSKKAKCPALQNIHLTTLLGFSQATLKKFATSRWKCRARELRCGVFIENISKESALHPRTITDLGTLARRQRTRFSYTA